MSVAYAVPAPFELGLPGKYLAWRPGQPEAILKAIDSDKPYMALCMPTGSGKSLVYMALAKTFGRTCVLTSTKGLQDQLLRDFTEAGLVDIRGMNNYRCLAVGEDGAFPFFKGDKESEVACDEGPCMGGFRCELQAAGCAYFDAKKAAKNSTLVVTNYSYWLRVMNQDKEESGLGTFNVLVLDEAHDAHDELADYLSVEIGADELSKLLDEDYPSDNAKWEWWMSWAKQLGVSLAGRILMEEDSLKASGPHRPQLRHLKALRGLWQRMTTISSAKGEWVQDSFRDHRGSRKLRFDPVDVKGYKDELFQHIPRVYLVSATVRPKTLTMLGLGSDGAAPGPVGSHDAGYDFMESNVAFASARRPVIHVPTVRMRYDISMEQMKWWVTRIDQIIDRRLDRKGIIHTTSYKRAQFLLAHSRHRDKFWVPDGSNTREIVRAFKDEPPILNPDISGRRILVSPAVTTGFDFPGDECRYQVIGKVPFPDTRSKVLKAREGHDKDYGAYVAMQTLVQACGRGMRSADDWCENFIIDDQWSWFKQKYASFAPKWFLNACRISVTVPDAMRY